MQVDNQARENSVQINMDKKVNLLNGGFILHISGDKKWEFV